MNKIKRYSIFAFSVTIIMIVIGVVFLNSSNILNPIEDEIENNYFEIRDICLINVGPNCTIRYHIKENTTFEVCESIFYDTIDIIYREELYEVLNNAQKQYTGGHEIVFLTIEFTTKEEDKASYGLICEFMLDNPPVTSTKYNPKEAVWRCVDFDNNFLGEYTQR